MYAYHLQLRCEPRDRLHVLPADHQVKRRVPSIAGGSVDVHATPHQVLCHCRVALVDGYVQWRQALFGRLHIKLTGRLCVGT